MPKLHQNVFSRSDMYAARSASAEMHSGFASLRGEFSMDLNAVPHVAEVSEATRADIRRIVQLWTSLRDRFAKNGPWLVGGWSIADAFYTPVASRFRTYGIDLAAHGDGGAAAAYAQRLLETPEFLAWEAAALAED